MSKSYRQVLDHRRLDNDSTYLKTFLLEFDWPSGDFGGTESDFLRGMLTVPPTRTGDSPSVPRVCSTDEEGFYSLVWEGLRSPVHIFFDTATDPKRRFWIAYSMSPVSEVDRLLDRLSSVKAPIDRVWLWPDLLATIQEKGEFRGIGTDYDHRPFQPRGDSTEYLKLQIYGGPKSHEILQLISQQPEFKRLAVLSKIRMKYYDVVEDIDRFSLEDIKYNGKFTTRGTSFDTHQSLVTDLRATYAQTIESIEAHHTIKAFDPECPSVIEGQPIFFSLDGHSINDLDSFCSTVFCGYLPFRLLGLVGLGPASNDCRLVSAVDAHTGSKLFFEIYPDLIMMYLYPGACGNTVARFYTNLQQTLGSVVRGEDNEGNTIF